ncbi:MAG: glycosyltransferase family 39 protein [Lentisphaeria bacterium]|nr:glycosyltransferase family 39 protein [Lentisphaeria bacterium]
MKKLFWADLKRFSLPGKREDLLYPALAVIVLALLYGPFMRFFFLPLWDDGVFILFNDHLAFCRENLKLYFTAPFQDLYTPVTMVSLMADHLLFGKEPLGYHLHNLLLHMVCTGTVYFIFRRFGIRPLLAFAGTLLWALNPQKVESVIWVTERKDVLSGAFALLSFLFFMRSAEKKSVPVLSTVLASLALLAKPSTVPLPGVMIVFLFCAWGKKHPLKEYLKILLLPLLSCGIILAVSYFITAKNFPGGLEKNPLVPLHNLFWYPLTALFPQTHPIWPPILQNWSFYWKTFAGGRLSMILLALWGRKTGLGWKKLSGWFLIIGGLMVPVLGMLNYTNFDYCDRYNYLVSIAVTGLLALLCERTLRRQPELARVVKTALLLFCGIFFVQSRLYLPCWENSQKLFALALEDKTPSNVKLYSVGAHSAIVSGDTPMLAEIAKRAFRDWKYYSPLQGKALYRFANYLALHLCVLENDFHAALPFYREVEKFRSGKTTDFEARYENAYLGYLFRNMALTAAYHGMRERALFYLDEYFRFCETGQLERREIGYYTAMALKAQLKGDKKLLMEALENIVRIDPGLTRYKEDLRRLKGETSSPPPPAENR